MTTRHQRCWLLVLFLCAGCNRQDTEALQSISRKLLARSEALTGEVKTGAASSWQNTPAMMGLEARVLNRLRWDKQLADVSIDIKAIGNVVEVQGKVRNLEQRRRVVMLAESTTGVEGVRDLLEESDR
jgi:osmotically-inducible protein OsmY